MGVAEVFASVVRRYNRNSLAEPKVPLDRVPRHCVKPGPGLGWRDRARERFALMYIQEIWLRISLAFRLFLRRHRGFFVTGAGVGRSLGKLPSGQRLFLSRPRDRLQWLCVLELH